MKRLSVFIITAAIFSLFLSTSALAFGGVEDIPEFNDLDGDQQYLKSDYRENYYLDIEKLGILDSGLAIMNDVANALFSIVSFLGYCIVAFFYFCFTFDIGELFGEQINAMQAILKSSIFDSFFILAFAFAAWELAKKLAKRNLNGMMIDGAKIVLILLLSSFVVRYSGTTLTAATNITKDLGVAALSGLNGGGGTDTRSYAVSVSANLWKSLVHDPWVTFEFGSSGAGGSEIKEILSETPRSEDRQMIVQGHAESNPAFQKNAGGKRIGFIIVYLIPFLVKSAVFLLMAVIQIAFQVMALFFVLLAPVILLMSLIPALGGLDLITLWLKKVFETQLMILIITFLIGVIVKVDALLYSKTPQLGWMIVILMETLISLIVFFNYKSILSGLGKINDAVRNPRKLHNQLRYSGDVMQAAKHGMQAVGGAAGNTIGGVKTVGKGSLNVANRIQQISADAYNRLADYYNPGDDTAPDPATPATRRQIKTPSAAQPLPATARTENTKTSNGRRSKVPYLDVAFVEVTDEEKTLPRPSIPRVEASPKNDTAPDATPQMEKASLPVTSAQDGEKAGRSSVATRRDVISAGEPPPAGYKRPAAVVETFRRPTDTAADEAVIERPKAATVQLDAAPPETAKEGRKAATQPQAEKAPGPTANVRKSSPTDGKQTRGPHVTMPPRRRPVAVVNPAGALPADGQPYSATMAAFRRPAAAANIVGEQPPVNRPSSAAPGNAMGPLAQESSAINRPDAITAPTASASVNAEKLASRPRTKNTPVQAAAAPTSVGNTGAVKTRPSGRAAPQSTPAAQHENGHVPHARVNLAQPLDNMKPIERPTLQVKAVKTAPSSNRPQRAVDKSPRRPPTRSPAGAKIMPAGDTATMPRPATPAKMK